MQIDLTNRLYKVDNIVYYGTIQKPVHNQRGRLFVCMGKKQIHIDHIPVLPKPAKEYDIFSDYILSGLAQSHPCHAMTYWVIKYRSSQKINPQLYKKRFHLK